MAADPKQLVLDRRSAEHAADPMRLAARLGNYRNKFSGGRVDLAAGFVLKIGARVQRRIGGLPEGLSMIDVGSTLGLNQDDGARSAPEFRREAVGQHLEFLDGADIHALPVLVLGAVVIGDAVGLKGSRSRAGPVEGSRAPAG